MRSLRIPSVKRILAESFAAKKSLAALRVAGDRLGIVSVRARLKPDSPLYQTGGGECVELPLDRVIAPLVLQDGHWQLEELDFLTAHAPKGDCLLIDIGANVGLFTRQVVHRLPNVRHAVCFEPHPGHLELLRRNLSHLSRCTLVPSALGPQDGELTFYEELENAGNYSMNIDAMRNRAYRTSHVQCLSASESALLSPVPGELRHLPIIWKSDTQGFDEVIMTMMPIEFWDRVHVGVMEMWRIVRSDYDTGRLAAIFERFAIRRSSLKPELNLSVKEILEFANGSDYAAADVYFAKG
jgi:FkbM family methyltransferase